MHPKEMQRAKSVYNVAVTEEYQTGKNTLGTVYQNSTPSSKTNNNSSINVYRHVPSEQLSPMAKIIDQAITDVPKLPARFDRHHSEVMGIYEHRKKDGKDKRKGDFSKFMLERLKKNSILNHEVFKHYGIDYKKQVAHNYLRY